MSTDANQLAREAKELQAAGRLSEAASRYEQLIAARPASGAAEHNLAAVLGDLGRWSEAERHIRQAMAKGVDAPESWLILGRAVTARRPAEAERAYLEAIRRRGDYLDAHRDLAQLRWMQSADVGRALETLEAAIRAYPTDPRLEAVKAQVLANAGLEDDAHALLLRLQQAWPSNAAIAALAAQSALARGDADLAVRLGAHAEQLAPHDIAALVAHIDACLARGLAERAAALAERFRARAPHNQHAIALQALAWRLLGDPRYEQLYDYKSLVLPAELSAPPGWNHIDAYLADLAQALAEAHAYQTHPFDQSIKHGTQAASILDYDHPALHALPQAIDPPIRRYLDHLGAGSDPLRRRNGGAYAIHGIWSIRMRAGGFHVNHIHPDGWISSACYVTVPERTENKEGWLKFGEPRIATSPPLGAEFFVEPKPGRLVLFPSYMWHGTVPFSSGGVRTTFALDIVPV